MDNNLQSDNIPVRWTDGQIMDIDVIMCCVVPGPEGVSYGKLPDGTRVKLTIIGFCEKGIKMYVQKRTGNPTANQGKRKSTSTSRQPAAKKPKKKTNNEQVSEESLDGPDDQNPNPNPNPNPNLNLSESY